MINKRCISILFLIIITLSSLVTSTSASTWTTEVVDTWTSVSWSTSSRMIAIDAYGHPHIVYGYGRLSYAYNDGKRWYYEIVDSSSSRAGQSSSIAVDSAGKVHICYYYDSYPDTNPYIEGIKYATNASGYWKIETIDSGTVDSGQNIGLYTSIAVDADDKVHISYQGIDATIKYATNASGSWETETVSNSGYGQFTSIALDSSGKAHISYYDGTNYDLNYATNISGSWVITTVGTVESLDWYNSHNSIAVDKADNVHISYYGGGYAGDLKYATNVSGSWETETVDSPGTVGVYEYNSVGLYNSIAVDTSGKVHISYNYVESYASEALKYATNTSGSWVTTTVKSGKDTGQSTSIAIDTSGKAHIRYYDSDNDTIEYATNTSGYWITTIADFATSGVGYPNSIAIDTSGKPHISYRATPAASGTSIGILKYATTNATGSWVLEIVDSSVNVRGTGCPIAVDTSGKVHISYSEVIDSENGNLKYATNASGYWKTETVDHAAAAISYVSLALDKSGKVHISYNVGFPFHYLMYATNASGYWKTEIVDDTISSGEGSSIAVDKKGKAHIGYFSTSDDDTIKYATNVSGSWKIKDVGKSKWSIGRGSPSTSIAVDPSRKVHMSYHDNTFNLAYATNASGSWITTAVDSGGYYNSIALDTSGKAHISYEGYSASTLYSILKYATNISGSWKTETIDNVEIEYSSIAFAPSGKVHTSYYTGELKHASYAVQSMPTPTSTPQPSPPPTVTQVPTAIPMPCKAKAIVVSPAKLQIKVGEGRDVIVTVEGENGCPAEGVMVNVNINKAGKKNVSVLPEGSAITDADGNVKFTVIGKKKGVAKVVFTVDSVKEKITVKVK